MHAYVLLLISRSNPATARCQQLAASRATLGLIERFELVRVRADGTRHAGDVRSQGQRGQRSAPFGCARLHGLRLDSNWSRAAAALYARSDTACPVCRDGAQATVHAKRQLKRVLRQQRPGHG
jgi:hypothetical protein